MDDIIELSETPCPNCGNEHTYWRDCSGLACEDGYKNLNFEDPINFPAEGEEYKLCTECFGQGIEEWCPSCGYDISRHKAIEKHKNRADE